MSTEANGMEVIKSTGLSGKTVQIEFTINNLGSWNKKKASEYTVKRYKRPDAFLKN